MSPGIVQIGTSGHDRSQAQAAVQQLVARLMEASIRRTAAVLRVNRIEVLDPASLPRDTGIHRVQVVLLGLGAGLLLGAFWQWTRLNRAEPALPRA